MADKIASLSVVLSMLQETDTVSSKHKPHMPAGEYKGFMECHVENDLLPIWIDNTEHIVTLVRSGTHSELFR